MFPLHHRAMGVRFSLRLCLTLPSGPLFTSSGRVWGVDSQGASGNTVGAVVKVVTTSGGLSALNESVARERCEVRCDNCAEQSDE